MILSCPSCNQLIDISDLPQSIFQCPSCGETIEVPQLQESTCPICCGNFSSNDSLVMCQHCKTVYHSECWEENHGCSTYGCQSTQHLETHNTAGGAGDDVTSGMVVCSFCGTSHASSDLVCPSCGHLLQESLSNNDNLLVSELGGLGDSLPKLGRNFKLLMKDVQTVISLALKAYLHYADFKRKTPRDEYWAFVGSFSVLTSLLFLLKAGMVVWVVLLPGSLVPILAITVRRLRDTGLSPWMILAIPILPFLVLVPSVEKSNTSEECS